MPVERPVRLGHVLDREAGPLTEEPHSFAETLVDRLVALDHWRVLLTVRVAATIHVALPCMISPPDHLKQPVQRSTGTERLCGSSM
jgi:hypothetical protein